MMRLHHSVPILGLCLLPACSSGGTEDRPQGEVRLAQSEHMFGFKSPTAFVGYPVKPTEVTTDRGILQLADDSTYKITRDNTTSESLDYQLDKTGFFGVTAARGSRTPTIRYSGGFGVDGSTGHYYFTDRYTTTTAPIIGLYLGVRVVTGSADLAGDWHCFSEHVIFSATAVQEPDNVGRTLGGTVAIDSAGKILGKGAESTKSTIDLTGSSKAFADGRVDVTLTYKDAQTSDARVFTCGAAKNFVVGTDEDLTDGEGGLLAMVRKRTGRADLTLAEGAYWVGLHTIFVNPSRPGTDAAHGTLELTAKGSLRIDAVGANGTPFSYTGSYTLADDGGLTITIDGTSEKWLGAIDQDYKTVVIVDHVVEQRSNNKPELNLFVGVRKAKVP